MNEEEKVKKQLVKNMILNLITFSIIFYLLGIVIYTQFTNSLYMSADSELEKATYQISSREQNNKEKKPIPKENIELNEEPKYRDQNPRLVFIERNQNGEIIEDSENIYRLNEIFTDVQFDTNQLNLIYENLAKKYNCYFLSNDGLDVGIDGVHLTEESHKKLAELLYNKIKDIYIN